MHILSKSVYIRLLKDHIQKSEDTVQGTSAHPLERLLPLEATHFHKWSQENEQLLLHLGRVST